MLKYKIIIIFDKNNNYIHKKYIFEGYDHRVVVHERGFGYGSETTNHIESFWAELRNLTDFN